MQPLFGFVVSLTDVTFDVLRSVVFFYIKTPLRVKEAGLEELIPTTWWPTHFDKEVKHSSCLKPRGVQGPSEVERPPCVGCIDEFFMIVARITTEMCFYIKSVLVGMIEHVEVGLRNFLS